MTDKRVSPADIRAAQRRVQAMIRRSQLHRRASVGEHEELVHIARRWGRGLRFVGRTEAPNRTARASVRMDALSLDAFRRNPVVLWRHDHERLPIGRGRAWVSDHTLHVEIVFDRRDRFARQVERKYRRGFLHAVSVQLDVFDYQVDDLGVITYTDAELIEVSAVPIPADSWAVRERGAE